MEERIIEIENLSKKFGDVKAVDDISFDVRRRDLFAFLGENGAGKSTTINILCSLLRKNAGKVLIDGLNLDRDAERIKTRIGIVFQQSVLDERLTVRDNLTVRGGLYGLAKKEVATRIEELSATLGMDDFLKRPYGKLSGGQRRRADIARGLINHPKLLFLDEPTTGLDPKSRRAVWDMITRLKRETDMTVFLTTHYMEEAEGADDVVIMNEGKICARGTPNDLKNRYSGDYLLLYTPASEEISSLLAAEGLIGTYDRERYKIRCDAARAVAFLSRNPRYSDFEIVKGNMDDVFLNVTGKTEADRYDDEK